jgi:hypothetical protein
MEANPRSGKNSNEGTNRKGLLSTHDLQATINWKALQMAFSVPAPCSSNAFSRMHHSPQLCVTNETNN